MEQNKIAVTVREATQMVSLGKTKIHELLASWRLKRVKVGRRTLVTVESLRHLIGDRC